MKQAILTQFPWPWLPTIALLIFFIFFVGLVMRLSARSLRPVFKQVETLPLDDGEKYE